MNKQWMNILMVLCLVMATGADAVGDAQITSRVELRVEGMSTPICPVLVREAVLNLDGIRQIEVSLESGVAKIGYDPSQVTLVQIQSSIRDQTGFKTRVQE